MHIASLAKHHEHISNANSRLMLQTPFAIILYFGYKQLFKT